ncbi:hypothetical protein GOQ27_16375 [Clostridium sp. D2Q-11]|uniref:Uncharacterized protein n=1 Tax=Anaeromonas frigoriresistens TaxID=2683708 RepID=A0A942UYP7_9FIRM|nr:hypothetical protein [Anaeromonas frigoriresistens]MBS4540055.1 hypothetical protein [Anaeromonas frigoriresistens]
MANGYDSDPGENFVDNDLNYVKEHVCIITDKVYAHCQQRECFPDIEQKIEGKFESIKFGSGFIVPNTLIVSSLPNRDNFKRVRFTLRIPYVIKNTKGETFEDFLPDILKDIVLFIPDDVRDEFDFRIVVETSSKVLGDVDKCDDKLNFAVGVFIIVKVVGRVQLLIPAFGFCPEPPECEEFSPEADICESFDYLPFPDFFPPQFEDLYPEY